MWVKTRNGTLVNLDNATDVVFNKSEGIVKALFGPDDKTILAQCDKDEASKVMDEIENGLVSERILVDLSEE